MGFLDGFDFEHLKNEAERLVINEMENQLETFSEPICKCNDCILDMAAMALNSVKPLYRVSLLGSLYAATAMDEENYATEIREGVFAAIERIRKFPSHDIEE
jgi:competence protein ComFB